MSKTGVVFTPIYYRHNPGKNHPESAKRLSTIIHELKRGQLSKSRNWQFVEPEITGEERARTGLVHDANYIEKVENLCKSGGGRLDAADTRASPESFEVALNAVAGALKAVDVVMKTQFDNAFALLRPPGHHAGRQYACGFCIFNNVSVAAEYLLRRYGLKRILILDIDSHHGNGTQEIFYEDNEVAYIGLHEDPLEFPGKGFMEETGRGEGSGYNVNIPLPFKTYDHTYMKAIEEIAIPIVLQYKPQFILVSSGFDAHYADPVGELSLTAHCYEKIYEAILNSALQTCDGRVVSLLEGGYNLRFVGRIAASSIAKLSESPYIIDDKIPTVRKWIKTEGEVVLKKVKRIQREFWKLN